MHALAFILLAAPPGDVVQTHDLGKISWQRAKALEGRRVRVRFTLDRIMDLGGPVGRPDDVLAVVAGPEDEFRYLILRKRATPALAKGARLEAVGVLEVLWLPTHVVVLLDDARLVK
jgi:hypothetical protein